MILFSYFSMMVNDSICSLIITTIDNGLCHHTLCFSPGQYPFSLMRDSKHTCTACLYYKHQSFHNYNSKLSIKSEGGKVRNVRVATCAIFRRKVRYVRSICGVRWSALRVRSICCVSIKYEFVFDKSRKISINIIRQ